MHVTDENTIGKRGVGGGHILNVGKVLHKLIILHSSLFLSPYFFSLSHTHTHTCTNIHTHKHTHYTRKAIWTRWF